MTKRFLGVLLALFLCAFNYRPKQDPYNLAPVISAMMFPGVETEVRWQTCGTVNAYYEPAAKRVTLCRELRTLKPGVIRYILAHELAHGVIIQRDVAFVGSSEWAADELSSLVLILMGNEDDVREGGEWWLGRANPEDPYDEHLGDERRGYGMLCMVITHKAPFGGCDINYWHVLNAWLRLLDIK